MKRQLSSSMTFFYKRVFPVIWFSFVGLFLASSTIGSIQSGEFHATAIAIPLVLIAFGYFLMRTFVFDLVDEVFEENESLIIRNQGESDRIPFTNIINVDSNSFVNPPRITLTLRKPCSHGQEISFSPLKKFGFAVKNPIASDLIGRIDVVRKRTDRITETD